LRGRFGLSPEVLDVDRLIQIQPIKYTNDADFKYVSFRTCAADLSNPRLASPLSSRVIMPSVKQPDELSTELDLYKTDSETTIQNIVVRSVIQGVPFIGSSIMEIFNGLAQRRAQERLNDVFDEMKNRLDSVGHEKLDREFFKSEEFQTLLFLLIERLHTTHDTEKLKMFGNALANSGNTDFKNDPREDYIRILRDLGLKDMLVLDDFRLKGWTPHIHRIDYSADVLVSLARLHGMGLVIGNLKHKTLDRVGSSRSESAQIISDMITQPPKMQYSLSTFGDRFLRFVLPQSSPPGQSSAEDVIGPE
jgi:hypothetical protein